MTEIVGIFLLRNEDIFVERSVLNVLEFCDRIIVAENYSSDNTWSILQSLSKKHPKIELSQIRDVGQSHDLIAGLAGKNVWVFGVDGDEIYDPDGLKRFRRTLLSGIYDDWWSIFGNVLNVTDLSPSYEKASGYLAPPCRSITKLYNFNALESWDGPCPERLHGGTPVFRSGYHAGLRLDLHSEVPWKQSDFRCLHTCFIRRSSREAGANGRVNPAELNAQDWLARLGTRLRNAVRRNSVSDWKREKYMRGDQVTLDIGVFFPDA